MRLAFAVLLVGGVFMLPPVHVGLRFARVYFGNLATRADWRVTGQAASLPFEFERHVLLPIQVNDGPTLQFALDTGAQMIALIGGPHTDALNLDVGGGLPIGGSGAGASPMGYVVANLDLRLGPVGLLDQNAVLIPWQAMSWLFTSSEQIYMHGIIGYDLLRRYVVELDFESETLTLHRPESFAYDGDGVSMPLTFTDRKPYTVAHVTTLDGRRIPVKLHVDLGQTSTLSLIPGSKPGIRIPAGAVTAQGWGLSGTVEKRMGRIQALEFGRYRLNDVTCSFTVAGHATAAGRQGVMGLGVLSRFRVVLDYPRKRMILEETSLTHEPFKGDMSGVSFRPQAEFFVINRVRGNSPASEAGLREGDLLLEIDGKPVRELRLREVDSMFQRGQGKRTHLVLRRNEEIIEAELVPRRRY